MVTQVDFKVVDFYNMVQKLIDDGMDLSLAVKTVRKELGECSYCGAVRENYLKMMGRPCHEEHGNGS